MTQIESQTPQSSPLLPARLSRRSWIGLSAMAAAAVLPLSSAWAAEPPASGKGAWTVISERLLADLEKEGKKPAYPGMTTGVTVDRTTGEAFVFIPGHGVWRTLDKGARFERIDGGKIGGRCETGWTVNMDPAGKRMACFMLDGLSGVTLDGGKTWTSLGGMGRGWDYAAVDWTARDPKVIFALKHESGGEFYLSADCGATWKKLGADPKIQGVGLASAGTLLLHRGMGIERSVDGGTTWTRVSDLTPKSRVPVMFEGGVYWAGAEGLIVSRDEGKTWAVQGAPADAVMGPFFGKTSQDMVVVGKQGFLATTDGGKSWKPAAPLPSPKTRVDWFGNFAWDPQGDVFYFANMAQPAWKFER